MHKLVRLIIELVILAIIVGLVVTRYYEIVAPFLPWLVMIVLSYMTWEHVLSQDGIKLQLGRLANRSQMAYLYVFVAAGVLAILYLYGAKRSFEKLDSLERAAKATNELKPQTTPKSSINWIDPAPITFGTPLSEKQLNAISSVDAEPNYNPDIGTVLTVGRHPLTVTFNPKDSKTYKPAEQTVHIVVEPAPTKPAEKRSESPSPQPASSNCPGIEGNIYLPCTNAQVGERVVGEALKIENLAIDNRYNGGSPGSGDHYFNIDFTECCMAELTLLHDEAIRRIGPAGFDINEVNAWKNWLSDSGTLEGRIQIPYRMEARSYTPHLRRLGILLEQKDTPPALPVRLSVDTKALPPGSFPSRESGTNPLRIQVTVTTSRPRTKGYIVLKLDHTPIFSHHDYSGTPIWEEDSKGNKILKELLKATPGGVVIAFKIADSPFLPEFPIHFDLQANQEMRAEAFWLDE